MNNRAQMTADSGQARAEQRVATSASPARIAARLSDSGESDAVLLLLLREIRDELRALRSDLRRADSPLLDRALVAIRETLDDEAFDARRLLDLAHAPHRRELRAVLEAIVRCAVDGCGASRRLGRFLAQNRQVAGSGLVLTRSGTVRDRPVYRVTVAKQTDVRNHWATELLKG